MSYFTQWELYGRGKHGNHLFFESTKSLRAHLFELSDEWHTDGEGGELICAFMTDYSSAYGKVAEAVEAFSRELPDATFLLDYINTDTDAQQHIHIRNGERETLDSYVAYADPQRICYDAIPSSSDNFSFVYEAAPPDGIWRYMGLNLQPALVPTRAELLKELNAHGSGWSGISALCYRQDGQTGQELTWRYPISDGNFAGGFITLIQEGVLWIPYNEIDTWNGERLLLDEAHLLDENACQILADDIRTYADGLCDALKDAAAICRTIESHKEEPNG